VHARKSFNFKTFFTFFHKNTFSEEALVKQKFATKYLAFTLAQPVARRTPKRLSMVLCCVAETTQQNQTDSFIYLLGVKNINFSQIVLRFFEKKKLISHTLMHNQPKI